MKHVGDLCQGTKRNRHLFTAGTLSGCDKGYCLLQRPKLKAASTFTPAVPSTMPGKLGENKHAQATGSSLCPTHWGSPCSTHQGESRGGVGLLQALPKVAYLSTAVIQLALQLLPPDSLVFQLGLQLPHSPATSKGDKQSMKSIQTWMAGWLHHLVPCLCQGTG